MNGAPKNENVMIEAPVFTIDKICATFKLQPREDVWEMYVEYMMSNDIPIPEEKECPIAKSFDGAWYKAWNAFKKYFEEECFLTIAEGENEEISISATDPEKAMVAWGLPQGEPCVVGLEDPLRREIWKG